MKEFLRVVKFTLFSISAGLIELGVFTLLSKGTALAYQPKYIIALICSVVWNFTFNRKFTFQSCNNVPIGMLKVLIFYLIFAPLSTKFGNYLTGTLGWNQYISLGLTMVINCITEFLYQRFFVFRGTIDTKPVKF